jgi:hypothetical protein
MAASEASQDRALALPDKKNRLLIERPVCAKM